MWVNSGLLHALVGIIIYSQGKSPKEGIKEQRPLAAKVIPMEVRRCSIDGLILHMGWRAKVMDGTQNAGFFLGDRGSHPLWNWRVFVFVFISTLSLSLFKHSCFKPKRVFSLNLTKWFCFLNLKEAFLFVTFHSVLQHVRVCCFSFSLSIWQHNRHSRPLLTHVYGAYSHFRPNHDVFFTKPNQVVLLRFCFVSVYSINHVFKAATVIREKIHFPRNLIENALKLYGMSFCRSQGCYLCDFGLLKTNVNSFVMTLGLAYYMEHCIALKLTNSILSSLKEF